jgi:hypothetical protein
VLHLNRLGSTRVSVIQSRNAPDPWNWPEPHPAISGSVRPLLHNIIIAYYSTLKRRTGGTSSVKLAVLHAIILPVYFIIFVVDLGSPAKTPHILFNVNVIYSNLK